MNIQNFLPIFNIILVLTLLYFVYVNRNLIDTLNAGMNNYMTKDIANLKKVMEVTMHNDKQLKKKTDFILDVLEEDDKVVYEPNIVHELNKLDTSVPLDNDVWLDNMTSSSAFVSMLNN